MIDDEAEIDLIDDKTECIHKMIASYGSIIFEKEIKNLNLKLFCESKNASIWTLNGVTLLEQEKYEEAIIIFDKGLLLDPNSTIAWFCKGFALFHLGRYEEGINSFDRFLQESPVDNDTKNNVQPVILQSVGDDVIGFGDMAYWVTEKVKECLSDFYPGMEVNLIIENIDGIPMVTWLSKVK